MRQGHIAWGIQTDLYVVRRNLMLGGTDSAGEYRLAYVQSGDLFRIAPAQSSHVQIVCRPDFPISRNFIVPRAQLDNAVQMGLVSVEPDQYPVEEEWQEGQTLFTVRRILYLNSLSDNICFEPEQQFYALSADGPTQPVQLEGRGPANAQVVFTEDYLEEQYQPPATIPSSQFRPGSPLYPAIVRQIHCPLEWVRITPSNENVWRITGPIVSVSSDQFPRQGDHIIIQNPRPEHVHGQYRTIVIDQDLFRSAIPYLSHLQENLWTNRSQLTLAVGGTADEVYEVAPGETFWAIVRPWATLPHQEFTNQALTGFQRTVRNTAALDEDHARIMHHAGQQASLTPTQQAIIRAVVLHGGRILLAPGTQAIIQFTVRMDGDPTAELTSPAPPPEPNMARSRYDLLMDDSDPLTA